VSLRLEVTWEGLEGLFAYLAEALPDAFREAALEGLDVTGDDGVDRAKQLVAVDTGSLQKTIRKEPEAHVEAGYLEVGITAGGGGVRNPKTGREVDYAPYVEFGTSRNRPQPFIRPSLRWASRRFPDHFWEALSRRVEVE